MCELCKAMNRRPSTVSPGWRAEVERAVDDDPEFGEFLEATVAAVSETRASSGPTDEPAVEWTTYATATPVEDMLALRDQVAGSFSVTSPLLDSLARANRRRRRRAYLRAGLGRLRMFAERAIDLVTVARLFMRFGIRPFVDDKDFRGGAS